MPISLGSNISSLTAQRRLAEGTADLSKTFERLSSGMRINRASDDAAGLSISESLRTDRRVFNQAVRNLNDGVSLLAIADSAVENLSGIVIRLKELAEQSANGTFGLQQRKSLDAEAQALSKEYFRISRSTEFNGLSLFTGSLGELRLQAGYGLDGSILSGLGGNIGTGTFQGTVTYQSENFFSHYYSTTLGDLNGDGILDMVSTGYETAIRFGTGDGTFGAAVLYETGTLGSRSITLGDLNGDGILDMVSADNGLDGGRATVRLGTGDGTFGAAVSYQTENIQSYSITLGDLNGDGILDMVSVGGGSSGRATVRLGAGDGTFGAAVSYLMESNGSRSITLGDLNGDGILDMVSAGRGLNGRATVRLGTGDGTFGVSISYSTGIYDSQDVVLGDLNGDGVLDIVTAGYNFPPYQGYTTVLLSNTKNGVSPLLSFDLTTRAGALQALPVFTQKLDQLAKQRGTIGAFQSRIEVAVNTLQVASENSAAAASRITDVDVADESSRLTRLNILQQAASSVLAQANLQPQITLTLLR